MEQTFTINSEHYEDGHLGQSLFLVLMQCGIIPPLMAPLVNTPLVNTPLVNTLLVASMFVNIGVHITLVIITTIMPRTW